MTTQIKLTETQGQEFQRPQDKYRSPRLSAHVKRSLRPETSLAHADASPED